MKAIDIINVKNPVDKIVEFLRFACKELSITKLPKIRFVSVPIKNNHSISFASFQPDSNEIALYIKGRHILDIFRSLAHELVHFRQKLKYGNDLDGSTGSPHEDEANSVAGQIMRKFNKVHPELF